MATAPYRSPGTAAQPGCQKKRDEVVDRTSTRKAELVTFECGRDADHGGACEWLRPKRVPVSQEMFMRLKFVFLCRDAIERLQHDAQAIVDGLAKR